MAAFSLTCKTLQDEELIREKKRFKMSLQEQKKRFRMSHQDQYKITGPGGNPIYAIVQVPDVAGYYDLEEDGNTYKLPFTATLLHMHPAVTRRGWYLIVLDVECCRRPTRL